jgi:hypothetical protein
VRDAATERLAVPLPNFLLIGAAKCGTTNLADCLTQHPDVFFSRPKEPSFFSSMWEHYDFSWYQSLFEAAGTRRAIGEGSTTYSVAASWPAHERIGQYLPDARIIYLIRHPLRRMESMYYQYLANGIPLGTFSRAVLEYEPLLDGSLYWRQIGLYRRHFSDERILVILFDDLVSDPGGVHRRVFEFLGVDPNVRVSPSRRALNPRAEETQDSRPVRALRDSFVGDLYRFAFPPRVRARLRNRFVNPYFRRRIIEEVAWTDEALQHALGSLREDTPQILAYAAKPRDLWEVL